MDDRAIVERALRSSNRSVGCAGVGTIGLGAFMVLLHAADLDPSLHKMPLGGIVALYFFGVLFILVGALMFYAALVKGPAQGRAILHLLDSDPGGIERVEPFVIKTQGYEDMPGGQHGVRFFLRGGAMRQVLTRKEDVEPILLYVASRAPASLVVGK